MLVLAWRNIWRHRTRSLGAAVAVGFVVWMSVLYFGLVGAMRDGMYVTLTDTVGHVQVHIREYRDVRDFRQSVITGAADVRVRIEQTLPGTEVAAALEVPALLSGEDRARGALLAGMEQPAAVREEFATKYLKTGRLPAPEDLDGIALGTALARTLQADVGDTVYAFAPGTDGTGASAYTVVGLVRFPEPSQDARGAILSLPAAQDLAAPGAVSRFELHLPRFRRTLDDSGLLPLREQLQAALGERMIVETWRESYPALSDLERSLRPLIIVFLTIFFVLAGLLVVNTIYLSVIERTREFGVIIAMGARRGRVTRMVLAESLVLCATGAAAGLLLGLPLVARMARGFSYPFGWSEIVEAYGMPAVMYASIAPEEIAITLAFAIGVGLLAALWPARVAGRLAPVEAMRFVA